MIKHDAILNVITEALAKYVKECCDEEFRRGVERGAYEERCAIRREKEEATR